MLAALMAIIGMFVQFARTGWIMVELVWTTLKFVAWAGGWLVVGVLKLVVLGVNAWRWFQDWRLAR